MIYNPESLIRSVPMLEGLTAPPALGTTAYYLASPYYVVEAKVTEVTFYLQRPASGLESNLATCFYLTSEYPDGYWSSWPLEEVDSKGWNLYREATEEEIRSCVVTCWELGLDLPIGHTESVDEQWGPIFLNLSNAMRRLHPTRAHTKRYKATFLHGWIRRNKKFIASTHRKPVDAMDWPHYPRYGERKIYTRRK